MICLLLEAMGVYKAAILKSELLSLAVHFVNKGFDVVLVAFVWKLKGLLDHLLNMGGLV